jgi:hypothetical protein
MEAIGVPAHAAVMVGKGQQWKQSVYRHTQLLWSENCNNGSQQSLLKVVPLGAVTT